MPVDKKSRKRCPRCGALHQDPFSNICPDCSALEALVDVDLDDGSGYSMSDEHYDDTEPQITRSTSTSQAPGGQPTTLRYIAIAGMAIVAIVLIVLGIKWCVQETHSSASRSARVSFDQPDTVLPMILCRQTRTDIIVTAASDTASFGTLRAIYGPHLQVFAAPDNLSQMDHDDYRNSTNLAVGPSASSFTRAEVEAHGIDYIVFGDPPLIVARAIRRLNR